MIPSHNHSVSHEIESPCELRRLWNPFVKDGHNLLPKQAPEIFSSITFLQGDGGVGSIKQINFPPANKDFSNVKEQVEELDFGDPGILVLMEGLLGKKVKAEGGCICIVPHDEGEVKEIKEMSSDLFKNIEAYLFKKIEAYLLAYLFKKIEAYLLAYLFKKIVALYR